MKILFISDIHGISNNLEKIDKIIKDIDKFIVLGDLYSYNGIDNIENNKVKNFLVKYKNKLVCMKG